MQNIRINPQTHRGIPFQNRDPRTLKSRSQTQIHRGIICLSRDQITF